MIMRNILQTVVVVLVLGFAGLALGYGIFGKMGGEYVDLDVIFSTGENFLQKAVRSMIGIDEMRSKILWCGASGAFLGLLFQLLPRKRE
jgi:hypothetical protein